MGRLIEEMTAAGSLLGTEPLGLPRAQGARVRLADGAYTVGDELVRAGGFAFLKADS